MKEEALKLYQQDSNCCQCILEAFFHTYNKPVPKEIFCMCNGIGSGFGIGGMCGLLIAGIMIFGMLFDEADVKRLRIKLLNAFVERHGDLNCRALLKDRGVDSGCDELVAETAALICGLIAEECQDQGPTDVHSIFD